MNPTSQMLDSNDTTENKQIKHTLHCGNQFKIDTSSTGLVSN